MPPAEPAALLPAGQQESNWLDRHGAALLGTYGRPPRVLVRGRGAEVWDVEGRRHLDLLAGIATNVLGHAHPDLIAAVTNQLATLGHVSNLVATPWQIRLAERLLVLAGAPEGSRVFLCNSGTEANEAAFKLARRTGRTRLLAATGAFHGRTLGALALTHSPAYREPFEPLPAGVEHVPFGDVDALAAALAARPPTAAVVLEPIQGEGGVNPAPPGYLAAARRLTREHGALLILDEVQTGTGRTGRWFAHQQPHHLGEAAVADPSLLPDAVTLAKGLGGGVPVGALLTYGPAVSGLLGRATHGSTTGGNPVAAAAALATIGVIERDGLLAAAARLGEQLRTGVLALDHPLVSGVRGEGVLLAIGLTAPVSGALAQAALAAGFLVNAVKPDAIRLAPPLILSTEQAEEFLAALPVLLDAAAGSPHPVDRAAAVDGTTRKAVT